MRQLRRALTLSTITLVVGITAGIQRVAAEDLSREIDTTTVSGIIQGLYGLLSFAAGEEPDWELVRGLFLDEALVVFAEGAGGDMRALTADEFVEDFKAFYRDEDLVERGFSEVIEASEITEFGNMAHVFVVFQPHIQERSVGRRGLDSLQLTFFKNRWWITGITTDWEGPDQPIPARLTGPAAGSAPGAAG